MRLKSMATVLAALVAAAAPAPVLAQAAKAPPAKAAPAAPPARVAPAPTPASPIDADVRCLLAMAVLGQDKQRQPAAQIGAYFFVGRLSARAPSLDLPGAVRAQEQKMTPQQIPGELARCGPIVQTGMRSLQQSFAAPAGAAAPPAAGAAPAAPAPQPK
jgi:hypothetical protein